MNEINAIIIDGKVYEAVEKGIGKRCFDCDLKEWCATSVQCNYCHSIDDNTYFRYSQELTDKLNSK